jgi:hypothetical protein
MGNMKLDTKPASDHPTSDLVQLMNLSFEDYLVPVRFEPSQFLTMLRKDNVDLDASRVLLADGEPSGIALIARRGWTCRLAAMGVAKGDARQKRRFLAHGKNSSAKPANAATVKWCSRSSNRTRRQCACIENTWLSRPSAG